MAKRITLSIPHQLPLAEARERARALGDYFQNRYGMTMRWDDERVGHLFGRYLLIGIDASFTVGEETVDLDGKDPGMLLRKKATDYLDRKVRAYLDPATPVDALPRG